jgi:uncharacterized protein YydD (DUF2326 family)
MITRIYANDNRFKAVEFQKGLNVILADRQAESDDKDSRNGVGKTTLINVIHYGLGADLSKKALPVEEIKDWIFYFQIELKGIPLTVSRAISNAGIVEVSGQTSGLPVKPEVDEKTGLIFYKLSEWKKLLGICLFDLNGISEDKYVPTFRGLLPYFVRVGLDAYSKPFKYFGNQKSWQIQVSNAYLLGLNWRYATESQILKDQDGAAKALNTAINNSIVPTKGELEAERVRLQKVVDNEERELIEFKVHPKYAEFQSTANNLTSEIQSLNNKTLVLNRKLSRYEDSIKSESEPEIANVLSLYEDAGVHFGDGVKKSLQEAKRFHQEIVTNRKDFLSAEIAEIKAKISESQSKIERLSEQRSKVMSLLKTHGALEEFTRFQGELSAKKAILEALKEKITDIQSMTKKSKEIKTKRITLDSKLARDFEESKPIWEKAIEGFNENSLALYNHPGNLIINISENGVVKENAYKFDVEIPRSTSEGVGRMKVFCYDLMLVDKFAQSGGVDFLVHDTTMFDGVDSRQVAHALEYANTKGQESDFQYICFFNSDSVPHDDFNKEFSLDEYVRLSLSDKRPEDSLLGFHFELPRK